MSRYSYAIFIIMTLIINNKCLKLIIYNIEYLYLNKFRTFKWCLNQKRKLFNILETHANKYLHIRHILNQGSASNFSWSPEG